ncbi:hypothetical protein DEJ28_02765 [Curtobacterium sp. MCPF17_002]|uniref:hypothetical protein n=1 Tax=Curtobacterium sp. MCPF17_002 TaxID=2175645 RepID=UPI000DA97B5E|nr:hypothetical protein [Curtobacterium sp. MCPF17_002]WIB78038.1 hypothetical protein DEJ28_02765 [Curtobacterium sp. MCPF17_002]
MITALGALLVAALAVTVVARREWMPVVLGAAAGLPYSVAVEFGGNGIPLFYAAAGVAVVLLARTAPLRTTHWTANALVALGLWSLVITTLGPWMFAGIPVMSSRGGLDDQVLNPDALGYTVSNLAQVGYLVLAMLTVLFLVRTDGTRRAVRVALIVGTVLSSARSLSVSLGLGGFQWLFDTNPTSSYSVLAAGERIRGVFSEPSELSAFSVAATVFFLLAAARARGRARAGWTVLFGLACSNLLQASSGTALVASAVVVGAGLVVLAVRYVLGGGVGTPWLVLGGLGSAIAILVAGPSLWAPVAALVTDKVGSQSWNARTGGDEFAWGVAVDTLWLGTGLGGNRPSSFAMSVLSCLGVPGAALLLAVLVGAVVVACRSGQVAFACALLALLVAKVVGTPDLSTPILWLLLAACVSDAWRAHTGAPVRPGARVDIGVADGLEARLASPARLA